MTDVTLTLNDETADRLTRRAETEGLTIAQLLTREASRLADRDPFAFFGIGASDDLRGSNTRASLGELGFGSRDR